MTVLDDTTRDALADLVERRRLRKLPPQEERRRIRKEARVDASSFGEILGVSADSILAWETGRRSPRHPEQRERYAEALDLLREAAASSDYQNDDDPVATGSSVRTSADGVGRRAPG